MPLFLLGFSLGSGPATQIANELDPRPAGLILCQAYTSLRAAARRMTRGAGVLRYLLPNVWRTVDAVSELRVPLLVVHSSGDTLFPAAMAKQLWSAAEGAPGGAELVLLPVWTHNAVYLDVPAAYWSPILTFIGMQSRKNASTVDSAHVL